MERKATITRRTKETDIRLTLALESRESSSILTGVPFFDHMLTSLGSHASFDLTVVARGDIEIEGHHTIEDTAIVLGQALGQALGDKKGIRRFGDAWIPMDETLAHAAVDVSGRPYCVHTGEPEHMLHFTIASGGGFDSCLCSLRYYYSHILLRSYTTRCDIYRIGNC